MARPSAAFDRISVTELDVISGNLLSNDSDPDGQPLFLRFFDGERVEAKRGPDQVTIIAGNHGTFFVRPDGSFTYELDPDVAARINPGHMVIEQLTYKVSDGQGGTDVATLRLEISGALPGLELKKIDFEDLEPGTAVPDGYAGFDWGDGWVVEIDGGGLETPDAHVARPRELVSMISLESGADFYLHEIVLNGDSDTPNPVEVRAFSDGAPHPFYGASNGAGLEPTWMDLQWEGIDAIEITYSTPGMWIDYITVATPPA